MMKMNRLLCLLGIHTEGIRTAGCTYNINRCRWCLCDVWCVLKETRMDPVQTASEASTKPSSAITPTTLIHIDQKARTLRHDPSTPSV